MGAAGGAGKAALSEGEKGRPPAGVGIMLRIYFVQHRFNLSDPERRRPWTTLRRGAALPGGSGPCRGAG